MEKINLVELLKDCPSGMELNCTMYEDVCFDYVDELNIIHCYIQHGTHKTSLTFNQHGTPNSDIKSKCVIFPIGKTTWEGFVPPCNFKDGDIITMENECGIHIFIYNYTTNEYNGYGYYVVFTSLGKFKINGFCSGSTYRLATEEEKEKLFDAIKANGYKWNKKTKTLEKLVESHSPEKFYIRIGDIPSEEKSTIYKGDVVIGYEDGVSVYDCVETDGLYRIVMPLPLKEGQGMTYECLIQEITQCRYKIENPRNVYLVSGIEVGKGHDNETLIKEVKILKDLTGQFNTKTDNTEETKTLEKLPKFKNGDIVAFDTEKGAQLFIFKEYIHDHWYAKSAKCYMMLDCDGEIDFESGDYYVERLATEEEKEKLFKAIKDYGYKWNEETKTWK